MRRIRVHMDLTRYRASASERQRADDLLRLVPGKGRHALDVGARDGHFSRLLAERFDTVTALDLRVPDIDHPRVTCMSGDIRALPFDDDHFDFVLCAEVLEHIAGNGLTRAATELARVTRAQVLIGVPFQQDIRHGRTTCNACKKSNPPWGHVNSFDEARLRRLFSGLNVTQVSFCGTGAYGTNFLSAWLMDAAGNPYGTYDQEERCIHCASKLIAPTHRTLGQRLLTRGAVALRKVTQATARPRPYWIHVLFAKRDTPH